jgi:hypothetical protein
MLQNIPIPRREPTGRKSKSALFNLSIMDVVHYPKNKKRFASVFHGSDTGGLLHCWRHLCCHTPIQVLSVMAGLYTCQQAGETHRNGGSGASMVDIGDGETLFKIWDYSRRNGYVDSDDHPPSVALHWFVVEAGICHEDEIEDGWRIPDFAYAEGMRLLRSNI